MFLRKLAAAGGVAGLLILGSAISASAAPVANHNYSQFLSGYTITDGAGDNGGVQFNEIRLTDLSLPSLPVTTFATCNSNGTFISNPTENCVAPDSFAVGVALQDTANGGPTYPTAGLALVWNDENHASTTGCASDQYTLEGNFGTSAFEEPLALNSLNPVDAGPSAICVSPGGSFYLELHYSTSTHKLAFVAGPSETNNATLQLLGVSGSPKWFTAGAGVDTTNGNIAAALPEIQLADFFRVGVTEAAGFNKGGIAGQRVTFDFFPSTSWTGTVSGLQNTVGNPITLTPSLLPATSSDFTVSAP